MIVDELAYKITVQADEFLNGKKKVEDGATQMRNTLRRTAGETNTAVGTLTGGFGKLKDAGQSAFGGLQMGAAKFLGVALTFEAARRTFLSTTSSLTQLGNQSAFLGMSARSLEGYQRAAAATGVSTNAMTSSLMRLKNAQLWSRTGMGAPDDTTLATLQLQSMTGTNILGAKDPGAALTQQAKALRALKNRDQAQVMWQRMGGDPEMFNLMMNGSLKTLQQDYEKKSNATPAAIKQAQDVTKTLEDLRQTANNVANDFVRLFGKDINEALQSLSKWLDDNKDDILGFFREMTTEAGKLTDAFGGLQNILKIYAGYRMGGVYGAAVAAGLVVGDETTPQSQKDLPDDQRSILYRKHGVGGAISSSVGDVMMMSNGGAGPIPRGDDWVTESKRAMQESRRKHLQSQEDRKIEISEGATNPDAATAPPEPNFWDRLLGVMGFGSAHASEVTPTIRRGPNVSLERSQAGSTLLDALMMTESGGNPLAYNKRSRAAGAYQFLPATAREMGLRVDGEVDERLDPEKSRAAANAYLSRLVNRYKGNVDYALKAYNWGMGNMDSWLKTGKGVNGQAMPLETQQYSGRVAGYYRQMTNAANAPSGFGYGTMDNSQTSSTSIGTVNVYSNPESADQLSRSVAQQAQRSHVTVSFSGGVNPS